MSDRTYRRNTSKTITVNYTPLNGINGSKIFFTVKANQYDTSTDDSTAIIKQTINMTANSGVIDLNPNTVADSVEPGKYFYDISVKDTAAEIYSLDSGKFTLNTTVVVGETLNSTVNNTGDTPIVNNTFSEEVLNATIVPGAVGPKGDKGNTGGIVPITVSTSAPSSPSVNDLWIDLS
jgi:hypothetical protein